MSFDSRVFFNNHQHITTINVLDAIDKTRSDITLVLVNPSIMWMSCSLFFNSSLTPGTYTDGVDICSLDVTKNEYLTGIKQLEGAGVGAFAGANVPNTISIDSPRKIACGWWANKYYIKYQGVIPNTDDYIRLVGMIYLIR